MIQLKACFFSVKPPQKRVSHFLCILTAPPLISIVIAISSVSKPPKDRKWILLNALLSAQNTYKYLIHEPNELFVTFEFKPNSRALLPHCSLYFFTIVSFSVISLIPLDTKWICSIVETSHLYCYIIKSWIIHPTLKKRDFISDHQVVHLSCMH